MLVLVIGLSIPTVFATHPDAMTLTFDKESYDFGDEVIVSAQLTPVLDSPAYPIGIKDSFKSLMVMVPKRETRDCLLSCGIYFLHSWNLKRLRGYLKFNSTYLNPLAQR